MNNKQYKIDYSITLCDGCVENHTTIVKNCMCEMHAKIKLKGYLDGKYSNMKNVNMYNISDDSYSNLKNMFENMDNPFSDLLKGFGGK